MIWKKVLGVNIYAYLFLSGINLGVISLSLNGTPFVHGWIGGDLGRKIQWALEMQQTGSINYSYPPGWLIILNILSGITGDSVINSLKLSNYILSILTTSGLLIIYTKILPKHLAGTFLLIYESILLNVSTFTYLEQFKYTSLYLTLALINLIIYRMLKRRETGKRDSFINVMLGALLGVIFVLYWGWLYWISPGLIILLLLVLYFRSKVLYKKIFEIGVGFAIPTVGFLSFYLNIRPSVLLTLIFIALVLIALTEKINISGIEYLYLGALLTGIAGILYFLIKPINDALISDASVTKILIWVPLEQIITPILVLILVGLLYIYKIRPEYLQLAVLNFVILFSGMSFALLRAFQMQDTQLTELWWRYQYVAILLFINIFLLLTFLLIDSVVHLNFDRMGAKELTLIFMFFLVLVTSAFNANKIDSYFPRNIPDTFGKNIYGYTAHQNCKEVLESFNKNIPQQISVNPTFGAEIVRACQPYMDSLSFPVQVYLSGFHGKEQDSFNWVFEGLAEILHVTEDHNDKKNILMFKLQKAPCQDYVKVDVFINNEFIKTINLDDNKKTKLIVNLNDFGTSPHLLSFISDSAPCMIPEDKRELIYSIHEN